MKADFWLTPCDITLETMGKKTNKQNHTKIIPKYSMGHIEQVEFLKTSNYTIGEMGNFMVEGYKQ